MKKVEINGSICIDFLVGILIYLERNIHEEKGKIKRSREKERKRCKEKERQKYLH